MLALLLGQVSGFSLADLKEFGLDKLGQVSVAIYQAKAEVLGDFYPGFRHAHRMGTVDIDILNYEVQ